jgi:hypothetical protein
MMPWRCVRGVASTSAFKLVKSVAGLFPRSIPRMGQRPPFYCWRSWCMSVNVLLWRLVLNLAV